MPIERIFLGWDRPVLDSAAAYLVDHFTRNAWEVDLSNLIVVTPGARAARNLLGKLIDLCTERGLACGSPLMLTPGQLPMRAASAHPLPPASDTARHLAWRTVLASTDPIELAPLVPFPPNQEREGAWNALADSLRSLHDELCGEMLSFADIPTRAASFAAFMEDARWTAASLVQNRYLELLQRWNLHDPAWSAMLALRNQASLSSDTGLVLVGVAELSGAARRVLESLESLETPVHALVFAPASAADSFDALGCIRADQPPLAPHIPAAWVTFTDTPLGQADAAFAAIAHAAAEAPVSPADVVIAVPDDQLVSSLVRRAEQLGGVRVRSAAGQSALSSPPLRFLSLLGEVLGRPTFSNLLPFLRHESVNKWLCEVNGVQNETWLTDLDDHAASEFSNRLPQTPLASPVRKGLARLASLDIAATTPPLRAIAEALLADLRMIFGDIPATPDAPAHRVIARACLSVRDTLAELADLAEGPIGAEAFEFPCNARQVLAHVLANAESLSIPDEPSANAIELLGWLEIPFDPAPVLVLTGMNEGTVPTRSMSDPFLPDGLRNFLGISCDRRRIARDAWLLGAAVQGRTKVAIIAARRDADGAPLLPSRLLMMDAEPRAVTDRLRTFMEKNSLTPAPPLRLQPGNTERFGRPLDIDGVCVRSMSITDFALYLASPYRFYLERILKLEETAQPQPELDPITFGNLIHAALHNFAIGPACHEAKASVIEEALNEALDIHARQLVGALHEAPPAVIIQLTFARGRLREVAKVQAQRRSEGWRIACTEWSPDRREKLWQSSGGPIALRGRIDRIDVNESSHRVAILDYKAGETIPEPAKDHGTANRWTKLQLPLYRHLAAELPAVSTAASLGKLDLGYFRIPRKTEDVGIAIAPWDSAALEHADAAAGAVVAGVRSGEFSERGDSRSTGGSIDRLCGVGFIGEFAPIEADEEEAAQ